MGQDNKREQSSAMVTILMIEDEALIRQFLCEALSLRGYRVLAAPDGVAALDIYQSRYREIDLVLTDLMMPAMPGPEMLALMRILNPAFKAIIMSGYYGGAGLTEECLANVVGMLRKPFSIEQLHFLVDKALHRGPLASPFLMEESETIEQKGDGTCADRGGV